jgi:hypothetical protein
MFNRMCWTLCPLTVALVLASFVESVLGKTAKAMTTVAAAMSNTLAQPAVLPTPFASTALSHLCTTVAVVAVIALTLHVVRKARSL